MAATHSAARAAAPVRPSTGRQATTGARDGAPSPIDVGILEAQALLVELGAMPPHEDDPFGPGVWALRERLQQYLTRRAVPTDAELGFLSELSTLLTQAARGDRIEVSQGASCVPVVCQSDGSNRAQMLEGAELYRAARVAIESLASSVTAAEDQRLSADDDMIRHDYMRADEIALNAVASAFGIEPEQLTPQARGFLQAWTNDELSTGSANGVPLDALSVDAECLLTDGGFRPAEALEGGCKAAGAASADDEERAGVEAFARLAKRIPELPCVVRYEDEPDPEDRLGYDYAGAYDLLMRELPDPSTPFGRGFFKALSVGLMSGPHGREPHNVGNVLEDIAATAGRPQDQQLQ